MRSGVGGVGALLVVGLVAYAMISGAQTDEANSPVADPVADPVGVMPAGENAVAAALWTCSWDPTINDDWHDDYLCSDGVTVDRPYLLPDDPYVEKWELDAAAADHAAALNG